MGMFDLTPDMVPALQRAQDTQQATNAAQLPLGSGPVYAGSIAGNMIGRGIGGAMGYQDPQMQKAQRMQQAMQETESTGPGFDVDPVGYTRRATRTLFKYHLYDEGMAAADKMKEMAQSQQAEATTAATNLTTNNKLHAERRIQQITADATGPDGKYDHEKATQVMMQDGNPEVRAQGIALAKEYQTIEAGNYIVTPPGATVFDRRKQKMVGDDGEYKAVAFPGEASEETNRRYLLDLSQIAKSRPLTAKESIIAKQAYKDYSKMNAGMTGIVDRSITPELNPDNFNAQPAVPGAAAVPGAGGPSAVARGVAGRTSPSSVTLPSGIKQDAPGAFQGAEGQKHLDTQVYNLTQTLQKANLPAVDVGMRAVTSVLNSYKDRPDELPGVGYLKNLAGDGAIGGVAKLLTTPEGRDLQSKIAVTFQSIMHSDIGSQQTIQEAVREFDSILKSPTATAREFYSGWANLTRRINAAKANLLVGFGQETHDEYGRRSKAMKGKGYDAMDLSPIPTVDAGDAPITKAVNMDAGPQGTKIGKPNINPSFIVGKTYTDANGNKAMYNADHTWTQK